MLTVDSFLMTLAVECLASLRLKEGEFLKVIIEAKGAVPL